MLEPTNRELPVSAMTMVPLGEGISYVSRIRDMCD